MIIYYMTAGQLGYSQLTLGKLTDMILLIKRKQEAVINVTIYISSNNLRRSSVIRSRNIMYLCKFSVNIFVCIIYCKNLYFFQNYLVQFSNYSNPLHSRYHSLGCVYMTDRFSIITYCSIYKNVETWSLFRYPVFQQILIFLIKQQPFFPRYTAYRQISFWQFVVMSVISIN